MRKNSAFAALSVAAFLLAACGPCIAETFTFTSGQAVEYALKNNKAVETARQKIKEAEAGTVISRAKFFPALSASASYTRLATAPGFEVGSPIYGVQILPVYDVNPPFSQIGNLPTYGITGFETLTLSMGSQDNYIIRASLQYPIFTWFKITNAHKISIFGLDAAREDLRRSENDIRSSVTEAFLRVQVAKNALDLSNRSYGQLQEHVKQAEDLYNDGKISKFDFLRAKVQLTAVKAQVTQVANGLVMAKEALKNYLNIDPADEVVPDGRLSFVPYEIGFEQALSKALSARPEIKSMDLTVQIAEKALAIADAGNKPMVVLQANYDYKNPDASGNLKWGTDWNATLAVNVPIFQGFEGSGKVDQAKAQLAQAKLGREQLLKGINLEVKSNYLQLVSSRDMLSSQDESVAEAKESLDMAAERYTGGYITNLEYLDAQMALSTAEMNYLKTLADYLTALAHLKKAMGE